MHVATRDGIAGLHHLPFLIRLAHRTLHQRVTAPFDPAQAPRCAQSFEWPSACRRGGAAGGSGGPRAAGVAGARATGLRDRRPGPPTILTALQCPAGAATARLASSLRVRTT